MRVLLAEDDPMLGRAMCLGLMQNGYAVDWVTDGEAGLAALKAHRYDCVLLDLGLPRLTGEEFLRLVRSSGDTYQPIIVITARGQVEDRILMLDQGADDYLVKPFDLEEMSARMRAVVRRSHGGDHDTGQLLHGPLTMSPSNRTVTWYGQPVSLTTKEFWILELLMRRRNRTVSRQQIEDALYGWGEEVESNAVQVHVHHLRRKLDSRIILTVRGVGYQLCPEHELSMTPPADPAAPAPGGRSS